MFLCPFGSKRQSRALVSLRFFRPFGGKRQSPSPPLILRLFPVFYLQPLHSFKMPEVGSDKCQMMVESRGSDKQVELIDSLACMFKRLAYLAVLLI